MLHRRSNHEWILPHKELRIRVGAGTPETTPGAAASAASPGDPAGSRAAAGLAVCVSSAAATTPAAAKNAMMRTAPCWKVATGSVGDIRDRIATSPATPSTVPTWRPVLRIPLPVPNLAGVSDMLPAPSSDGMARPTPAPPSS